MRTSLVCIYSFCVSNLYIPHSYIQYIYTYVCGIINEGHYRLNQQEKWVDLSGFDEILYTYYNFTGEHNHKTKRGSRGSWGCQDPLLKHIS